MHPVLKSAIEPLAAQIAATTVAEAQVEPLPGKERWSPQEIVEHLILSFEQTSASVTKQLKAGRPPKNHRSLLEFVLRVHTVGLGRMPRGITSLIATRPSWTEQLSGAELARRFVAAAEEMDRTLVTARKRFGVQACGEHPFYGVLRVDEWRRYHSIHVKHHAKQLRQAIQFAKTHLAAK
jgi:hypothetical protein